MIETPYIITGLYIEKDHDKKVFTKIVRLTGKEWQSRVRKEFIPKVFINFQPIALFIGGTISWCPKQSIERGNKETKWIKIDYKDFLKQFSTIEYLSV